MFRFLSVFVALATPVFAVPSFDAKLKKFENQIPKMSQCHNFSGSYSATCESTSSGRQKYKFVITQNECDSILILQQVDEQSYIDFEIAPSGSDSVGRTTHSYRSTFGSVGYWKGTYAARVLSKGMGVHRGGRIDSEVSEEILVVDPNGSSDEVSYSYIDKTNYFGTDDTLLQTEVQKYECSLLPM